MKAILYERHLRHSSFDENFYQNVPVPSVQALPTQPPVFQLLKTYQIITPLVQNVTPPIHTFMPPLQQHTTSTTTVHVKHLC